MRSVGGSGDCCAAQAVSSACASRKRSLRSSSVSPGEPVPGRMAGVMLGSAAIIAAAEIDGVGAVLSPEKLGRNGFIVVSVCNEIFRISNSYTFDITYKHIRNLRITYSIYLYVVMCCEVSPSF